MIKSMTGFGKSEATVRNRKITVEIRSLNSKQLDLNVKVPPVYRQSEYEIRNIVARRMQRGKVDLFVTVESLSTQTSARIDREAFREYIRQMNDALVYAGIDAGYDAMLAAVMRLPDVVAAESESVSDEERQALLTAVEEAVAQLDAFRVQEGAILIADLLHRVEKIEGYKAEVIPYEKARTETIRARILDHLAQLNLEVDRNRLEQEMIFYIEKLDINEEKHRLAAHLNYFIETMSGAPGQGKKLGFISQEMGREINTLGSKSNHAEMQRLVVKMKDELEQIKEQVLNVM